MHLTLFSPDNNEYIYSGEVISLTSEPKGFAGFAPVEKVTHITTNDRALLSDRLVKDAALRAYGIITTAINGENNTLKSAPADTPKLNAPSISDVFTIPSVAPNEIKSATLPAVKVKGWKKRHN
jgi:hypothetical protein